MADAPLDLGIDGYGPATPIGVGGSAVVYRSANAAGTNVAIKLIRLSSLDEASSRHFDRECRAIQRLSAHDGVVSILEHGWTDRGEPFIVMPLLPGSVHERLTNDGPYEWREAVGIVQKVSTALGHAHDASILHRDIKPGNILLDDAGEPVLADFGIAKILDATETGASLLSFTPTFASPERFEGKPASVRSEVYSLAATLTTLISGRAPFLTGDSDTPAAIIRRVLNDEPDLGDLGDVPDELRDAIQSSMAKDPAKRPPTMAEFADQLQHVLDVASPESRAKARAAAKRAERKKWPIAAAIIALVALTVAGLWYFTQRDTTAPIAAEQPTPVVQPSVAAPTSTSDTAIAVPVTPEAATPTVRPGRVAAPRPTAAPVPPGFVDLRPLRPNGEGIADRIFGDNVEAVAQAVGEILGEPPFATGLVPPDTDSLLAQPGDTVRSWAADDGSVYLTIYGDNNGSFFRWGISGDVIVDFDNPALTELPTLSFPFDADDRPFMLYQVFDDWFLYRTCALDLNLCFLHPNDETRSTVVSVTSSSQERPGFAPGGISVIAGDGPVNLRQLPGIEQPVLRAPEAGTEMLVFGIPIVDGEGREWSLVSNADDDLLPAGYMATEFLTAQ